MIFEFGIQSIEEVKIRVFRFTLKSLKETPAISEGFELSLMINEKFRASLRLGAIYPGAGEDLYAALSCYGKHIGLAFQIVDDILDVEESSERLGKTAGKDAQQQKITFPAVYGLADSRRMAEPSTQE